MKQKSIIDIQNLKGVEPIAMITAYDALFAKLFDEIVDIILVGDSLQMSFGGSSDTLFATMDTMIYHTKAVCQGSKKSVIVCDMPFGSYIDEKTALNNASKVYQETSAHAVKIEGGVSRAHIIKTLSYNSIAVMGHIGLLPQFVRAEGGYRIKGKTKDEIQSLIDDAKAVEDAGAFCMVIEGVTQEAAKQITGAVSIPTIGIGAGIHTDGQVLVWSDMLGFFDAFQPKFVKRYLNGAELVKNSVSRYVDEVKNRSFPSDEYSYK